MNLKFWIIFAALTALFLVVAGVTMCVMELVSMQHEERKKKRLAKKQKEFEDSLFFLAIGDEVKWFTST